MGPGDEVASVYFGNGLAGDGPVGWRRDGIFGGKILREGLAMGERGVRLRTPGSGIGDLCVGGFEFFWGYIPSLGGNLDKQIARCGSYAAKLRRHGWRGAAAEGPGIEGRQRGIAHDH